MKTEITTITAMSMTTSHAIMLTVIDTPITGGEGGI